MAGSSEYKGQVDSGSGAKAESVKVSPGAFDASIAKESESSVSEGDAAKTIADAPKTVDTKKQRKSTFSTITNGDIAHFQSVVGPENVLLDQDEVGPFVRDFTNKYIGVGSIVVTPTTTEQVAECLKYCNERLIAVVP